MTQEQFEGEVSRRLMDAWPSLRDHFDRSRDHREAWSRMFCRTPDWPTPGHVYAAIQHYLANAEKPGIPPAPGRLLALCPRREAVYHFLLPVDFGSPGPKVLAGTHSYAGTCAQCGQEKEVWAWAEIWGSVAITYWFCEACHVAGIPENDLAAYHKESDKQYHEHIGRGAPRMVKVKASDLAFLKPVPHAPAKPASEQVAALLAAAENEIPF